MTNVKQCRCDGKKKAVTFPKLSIWNLDAGNLKTQQCPRHLILSAKWAEMVKKEKTMLKQNATFNLGQVWHYTKLMNKVNCGQWRTVVVMHQFFNFF